jgi:hypothetical protein
VSGGIGNADEVDALTCKYEQELLFRKHAEKAAKGGKT